MREKIIFQHNTLKLPCRFEELQIHSRINEYCIAKVISIDEQKTVFLLEPPAVLCVRHSSRRLPVDLCNALQNGTVGLVKVLKVGMINNHWYTIDQKLSALPKWDEIDENRRFIYAKQMAKAINNLHNLGYCHLDIKPEHFGIDEHGNIRLIDFDSCLPYRTSNNECDHIEYTPEYAAYEIFEGHYSTASDYYSFGKTLNEWGHLDPDTLYLNWKKIVKHLLNSNCDLRYNYSQLLQVFNNVRVEKFTGPRTYKNGIVLGIKTAYSDRQLALFLSQNYQAADLYIQHNFSRYAGCTKSEKIARLIHQLDPALPLYWEGKCFSSTQEIASEFSRKYPQKSESMCELLKSGILLEFNAISNNDETVVRLLQNAREDSERFYWKVSQAFGGKFPVNESDVKSLTHLSQKITELNSLIVSRIQHGDPASVAYVLERVENYPDSTNIDSTISFLRAIPIHVENVNLTNIDMNHPFGKYIETRLPESGHHPESVTIQDLFSENMPYLISESNFEEWKTRNQNQREMRHRRNRAIGKAVGWTALGIAFLAILPYILTALAIIAVIAIIISIL